MEKRRSFQEFQLSLSSEGAKTKGDVRGPEVNAEVVRLIEVCCKRRHSNRHLLWSPKKIPELARSLGLAKREFRETQEE